MYPPKIPFIVEPRLDKTQLSPKGKGTPMPPKHVRPQTFIKNYDWLLQAVHEELDHRIADKVR